VKEHPSVYTLKFKATCLQDALCLSKYTQQGFSFFIYLFFYYSFACCFFMGVKLGSLTLRVFEDRVLRKIYGALKGRGNKGMEKTT